MDKVEIHVNGRYTHPFFGSNFVTNFKSAEAEALGVEFHFDAVEFFKDLDVVVLAVPLIRMQEVVDSLPINELRGKLVVDVSPLNDHPKSILLEAFANYPDIDVLVTNPLLGNLPREEDQPKSKVRTNNGATVMKKDPVVPSGLWEGRQMVFERARVANVPRCDKYLGIFENARCEVVEEIASDHDATISNAQFVTHLIGRLLDQDLLAPTPIASKEYKDLRQISEMANGGSFDRFYGMYKYNNRAGEHIKKLRENLASLECALAAKGAYLSAKEEMIKGDRQKLLSETRMLLQELAKSDFEATDKTRNSQTIGSTQRDATSQVKDDDIDNTVVIL